MDELTNGLGIWQIINSDIITDIIAKSGFNISLIDFEHGLHSPNSLQNIVFAAKSMKIKTIARLPSFNINNISQIIDTGVDGILYPHIEEQYQLDKVIQDTFLPPNGSRGYSPFVPKYNYGKIHNMRDKDPFLGILIESKKGLKNAESLVQHPLIDFVYFGAYDLSVEMKKSGEIFDSEILSELTKLSQICKKYKKKIMAIYRNKEELMKLLKLNINYPISSVDTSILLNALSFQYELYSNLINSQFE